jgi:hypothetical protein
MLRLGVKGALIAGVVSTALTWPMTADANWISVGLHYLSLFLALNTVLLALIQTIVLRRLLACQNIDVYFRRMFGKEVRGTWKPDISQLRIWNMPSLLLYYSVVCFLFGLYSIVATHLEVRFFLFLFAWDLCVNPDFPQLSYLVGGFLGVIVVGYIVMASLLVSPVWKQLGQDRTVLPLHGGDTQV